MENPLANDAMRRDAERIKAIEKRNQDRPGTVSPAEVAFVCHQAIIATEDANATRRLDEMLHMFPDGWQAKCFPDGKYGILYRVGMGEHSGTGGTLSMAMDRLVEQMASKAGLEE